MPRALVPLVFAAALAGCGARAPELPADGGRPDLPPLPAECAGPADGAAEAPYTVKFTFLNDSADAVYLHQGCTLDYAITSCASGYQDSVGPSAICACLCADPACTSSPACGACMNENIRLDPGQSMTSTWIATVREVLDRGPYSCIAPWDLPSARYRLTVSLYGTDEVGGAPVRTVTQEFVLPAPDDQVVVPLAR